MLLCVNNCLMVIFYSADLLFMHVPYVMLPHPLPRSLPQFTTCLPLVIFTVKFHTVSSLMFCLWYKNNCPRSSVSPPTCTEVIRNEKQQPWRRKNPQTLFLRTERLCNVERVMLSISSGDNKPKTTLLPEHMFWNILCLDWSLTSRHLVLDEFFPDSFMVCIRHFHCNASYNVHFYVQQTFYNYGQKHFEISHM